MSRKEFIDEVTEKLGIWAIKQESRYSISTLRAFAKDIAANAEKKYPVNNWSERYDLWKQGLVTAN
jgi:hypothetical protein